MTTKRRKSRGDKYLELVLAINRESLEDIQKRLRANMDGLDDLGERLRKSYNGNGIYELRRWHAQKAA